MESANVLMTGSSSGFGLLTTKTLCDRGHTVFATMRDPDGRNAAVARELRAHGGESEGAVHVLDLDVTDDASVDRAVGRAVEIGGTLDAAVNNAGIGVGGLAEAFTTEQYAQIFDINVLGVQRVNRAVLPPMRKRGSGLLVHVSSIMGRVIIPFAAPYTVSKFALEALAESYRYELARTGVDVAIVEPGGFLTGFGERMLAPADGAVVENYGDIAKIPRKMWSGPMERVQSEEGPSPQLVADAIADLIEMPAGGRPLRTVVDPVMEGAGSILLNGATRETQEALLGSLGVSDLLQTGRRA